MNAQEFAIAYTGVINNDDDGTLNTPPTASAWVDSATGKMIDAGAKTFDRNVLYIATDQCAQDLAGVIAGDTTAPVYSNVSVISGPPDLSFNATFQHGTESPDKAPWLQISAPTSDGSKTVTTQVNAGILATFFRGTVSVFDVQNPSRGFPGSVRALAEIKQQIQSAIDGAANF